MYDDVSEAVLTSLLLSVKKLTFKHTEISRNKHVSTCFLHLESGWFWFKIG